MELQRLVLTSFRHEKLLEIKIYKSWSLLIFFDDRPSKSVCWLIHCCNHDDDNSDKNIDNDKYYDKNINKCVNDDTKCTNSTMVT